MHALRCTLRDEEGRACRDFRRSAGWRQRTSPRRCRPSTSGSSSPSGRSSALATGAELPPKIGVHPRPAGSFAQAMPACLRGEAADGAADLIGMKWIAGFPDNLALGMPGPSCARRRQRPADGRPARDPRRRPDHRRPDGRRQRDRDRPLAACPSARAAPPRAAIVGAGVQGRGHVPVLGHLLPGVELAIVDRDPGRAASLAADARATPGVGSAAAVALADAQVATAAADVVVTCRPVRAGPPGDDRATGSRRTPSSSRSTTPRRSRRRSPARPPCSSSTRTASSETSRAAGLFDGYPDPAATLGEAILAGLPRPAAGRVVATAPRHRPGRPRLRRRRSFERPRSAGSGRSCRADRQGPGGRRTATGQPPVARARSPLVPAREWGWRSGLRRGTLPP